MAFFRIDAVSSEMAKQVDKSLLEKKGAMIVHFQNEPDVPRLVVQTSEGQYIYVGQYKLTDNGLNDLINMLSNPTVQMCPLVRVKAVELLLSA